MLPSASPVAIWPRNGRANENPPDGWVSSSGLSHGAKHDTWFKSAAAARDNIGFSPSKMGNFTDLRSTQPERVQLWRFGQSCRKALTPERECYHRPRRLQYVPETAGPTKTRPMVGYHRAGSRMEQNTTLGSRAPRPHAITSDLAPRKWGTSRICDPRNRNECSFGGLVNRAGPPPAHGSSN